VRKIAVYELLSLDGVAEAPDILPGWDDALDAERAAVIATQDAVILGRRAYTGTSPASATRSVARRVGAAVRLVWPGG
jgi:hypothetical protein